MGDVNTRTEEQVQEDIDDVDWRDELMDDILTHAAKTGHTLSVVTVAFRQPHQQTFLVCMSCSELYQETPVSKTRYAREIQREIKA